MFDIIAFDADDTLWYNEHLYLMKRDNFIDLLRPFTSQDNIGELLDKTEINNLDYYGYGIKSFILSMVETAVTLTDGKISGEAIQAILNFGKEMRDHPIKLYDGVLDILSELGQTHPLMIITKGDLFEQESKIARSGIADRFKYIEVVSEKVPLTYANLLTKYNIDPQRFIMIGNSLKSDVLPIVAIGATAVHLPAETTWAHEQVHATPEKDGYYEIEDIRQFPELITKLGKQILR